MATTYVKNRLSYNKRMSALQRAIDVIISTHSYGIGDRYFALRSAQERLIYWGNHNPVIKTPTVKPADGWDIKMICEHGELSRESILFYELQKAIHEMAAFKDEFNYGDIQSITIT